MAIILLGCRKVQVERFTNIQLEVSSRLLTYCEDAYYIVPPRSGFICTFLRPVRTKKFRDLLMDVLVVRPSFHLMRGPLHKPKR